MRFSVPFALAIVGSVAAKTVVITVGNTTADASTVFKPQTVNANIGDTVLFNFTTGNHTATQSTFGAPCIPVSLTDPTINGFNSGFRDTVNGTAITNLPVTVTSNATIWFFDFNTCKEGGVGAININASSTQTIDGFARNAARLNGTNTTSTTTTGTSSATQTSTDSSTTTQAPSDAQRAVVGGKVAIPLLLLALLSL